MGRNLCFGWTAAALLVLGGCAPYTLTFQLDEVINTGGRSDNARAPLAVDIVTLDEGAARAFPELLDGQVWSSEWFTQRERDDLKLRELDRHVFALRAGTASTHDHLLGPALESPRDTQQDRVSVQVRHPQPTGARSAFVIFGRFHDGKGGWKDVRPVVIRLAQVPGLHREILIGVGATELAWLGSR